MRLQTRILLLLVPLTVLPVLALGWAAYDQLHRTSEQKTLSQVATLLDQTQQMWDARLRSIAATAEVLSRLHLVKRYAAASEDEERYVLMQPTLLKLFADYQKTYPDYIEMRILLADGYEDVRSTTVPLRNHTEEEGDSHFFQRAAVTPMGRYQGLHQNPDTGTTALYTVSPILVLDRTLDPVGRTPEIEGYLAITVDTGFLQEHTEAFRIGSTGHLMFTNALGEVVFSPEPGDIGIHLPPKAMLKAKSDADLATPIAIALEHQGTSHRHVIWGHKLHESLYAFVTLDERELLVGSRRLAGIVTAIVLLTVLVTTVMLYALLNHVVVRPIHRLDQVAMDIGRGELDVEIDPELRRRGEIGRLAETIQGMALNLKQSTRQIRYLAYHDPLTGLPNRSMFSDYLQRALNLADRHRDKLAVLFIDIDNFKQVNDSLGHHAGDDLLKQAAERIGTCLRKADVVGRSSSEDNSDIVARLGGDEFTVLLFDVRDSAAVSRVAKRILDCLAEPIPIAEHNINVSASVGITLYPDDGHEPAILLRNADMAMYRAKENGRNNFQFYTDSMNEVARNRLFMEGKLRRALTNQEFEVHYHPIVDLTSGRLVGAEALVRWNDPDEGMVPPGHFVGVAEETGLIVAIGEQVLHQACTDNKAWQRMGLPPVFVAVNISAVQVRKVELDVVVADILSETGLDPRWLDLEITETSLLTAEARAARLLAKLRELGLRLSLDDFGTGYSSLSYLRRFPIDTLKIDRSFVRDIADDRGDEAIASAIIAMGRRLELTVVAEGIETDRQLATLRAHGCRLGQGYLFSRPIPAEEFRRLHQGGLAHTA